jgi:DNA-binding SARP family transcriptional activator
VVDGRRVDLSSRRERALLGVLLLHVGEVVSVDALIDSVWGERAPVSARHMVHEYVSRLRGALGDAAVITTRAPGYLVEREACELDSGRFAELLGSARSAVAAEELDEALKATTRRSVSGAVTLCPTSPSRGTHARRRRGEQQRGQLMLALYRDGRQADALERYREGRRTLVELVGIESGAELRALEQAILRHDPALAPPSTNETLTVNHETPPPPPRRHTGLAAAAAVVLIAGLATVAAVAFTKAPSTAASVSGDAVAVVDARASSAQFLSPPRRGRSSTAPDRCGSRYPMRDR